MAGTNVDTLARAMNITPRRVQQLAKEGMPKAERGLYDLGACMAWYIRYLQAVVEKRADPNDEGAALEYTLEKSRLAREQADRVALQNAEDRADLGRFSIWSEELTRFLTEIRAAILSLPTKVAPILDGDTNQRRQVLDEAVQEILTRLSAYRPSRRTARVQAVDNFRSHSVETAAAANSQRVGRSKKAAIERVQRRAGTMAN